MKMRKEDSSTAGEVGVPEGPVSPVGGGLKEGSDVFQEVMPGKDSKEVGEEEDM